jgi:shikimate dehydrogenase
MPHLSAISGEARQVGAVNTVNSAGMGFCTDGAGFLFMLQTEGINVQNKSVLMVGAGGAARAVVLELLNAGAFVEVYSRTYQKTADLCNSLHATYNRFHNQTAQGNSDVQNGKTCPSAIPLSAIPNKAYDIIINATGVGMHDSVGTSPVDEEVIARCHMAIDLIYRPAKSRFLELAERNGKPILNGLGMLFYQAYIAEQYFWNLPEQDLKIAKNLFEEYKKELQS